MQDNIRIRRSMLLTSLLTFNITIACFIGYSIMRFGTATGLLDYIKGDRLFIAQYPDKVSPPTSNDGSAVTFRLTNHGYQPIRIRGCRVSCSATLHDDTPFSIQPSKSKDLRIVLNPEKENPSQSYVASITIFTDMPSQAKISLNVTTSLPTNTL
jgi:hypothetical protein